MQFFLLYLYFYVRKGIAGNERARMKILWNYEKILNPSQKSNPGHLGLKPNTNLLAYKTEVLFINCTWGLLNLSVRITYIFKLILLSARFFSTESLNFIKKLLIRQEDKRIGSNKNFQTLIYFQSVG